MKSQQETFDHVVAHIRAQGYERSMLPDGDTCTYRGLNGLKCAIGCLIANDHYTPDLEGVPADAFCIMAAVKASGWDATSGLLDVLQYAHDCMDVVDFEPHAAAIAKDYGFTYAPPA